MFAAEFWEVLKQLLSRIIFGGCFWKESEEEKYMEKLVVSGFHFFQGSYLVSLETIFFLHKFLHTGAC